MHPVTSISQALPLASQRRLDGQLSAARLLAAVSIQRHPFRPRITNQEMGCIDLSIVQTPHAHGGLIKTGVDGVVGGTARARDAADRLEEGEDGRIIALWSREIGERIEEGLDSGSERVWPGPCV